MVYFTTWTHAAPVPVWSKYRGAEAASVMAAYRRAFADQPTVPSGPRAASARDAPIVSESIRQSVNVNDEKPHDSATMRASKAPATQPTQLRSSVSRRKA